ncbi:MAG TPA: DNA recombination protein RmuC [Burkholderiales bacterium]|nr:DNA recombination protein RmuC [Burkholderiales bacterium]
MSETIFLAVGVGIVAALVVLVIKLATQLQALRDLAARQSETLEQRHRAMLLDLHDGLTRQGDRLTSTLADNTQRLQQQLQNGLEQIGGKVNERLEEGFKKTNETFTSVMARLATIDEAQKKIETLTGSVVSLQQLLGSKSSRGAFGEVQLEALVRDILPPAAFQMQATLPGNVRVDCLLRLPEPTGAIAIDSKFPLENYQRMLDPALAEAERAQALRQFKADIRKHIDDIGDKYIVRGVTSDGAVMFVPAEAVFAEIHAHHRDLVDHAFARRVWIVSPTTLMAILNTARAVIKDVETRRQVHIIKDELARLGKDFSRFDDRLRKLADHIRQAHEDAQQVQISGRKLTQRFESIERVELDAPQQPPQLRVVAPGDEE